MIILPEPIIKELQKNEAALSIKCNENGIWRTSFMRNGEETRATDVDLQAALARLIATDLPNQ